METMRIKCLFQVILGSDATTRSIMIQLYNLAHTETCFQAYINLSNFHTLQPTESSCRTIANLTGLQGDLNNVLGSNMIYSKIGVMRVVQFGKKSIIALLSLNTFSLLIRVVPCYGPWGHFIVQHQVGVALRGRKDRQRQYCHSKSLVHYE